MTKSTRSSPPTPDHAAGRGPIPLDADALRALAWRRRGRPQEALPDETAPAQTEQELAAFRKASFCRE